MVIAFHDRRIKDIADRVLPLEDGRPKELATMLIDPVSGMAVERERAVFAELDGTVWYFCANGCHDEFLAEPARFLTAEDRHASAQASLSPAAE